MGVMVDGQWQTGWYAADAKGRFHRPSTRFREGISRAADARFRPEAGRYRLYISYACPWASRAAIIRAVRGLEKAIPMLVVNPKMGDDGWTFEPYPGTTPDIEGRKLLRELYLDADPKYSGRVTVPVL